MRTEWPCLKGFCTCTRGKLWAQNNISATTEVEFLAKVGSLSFLCVVKCRVVSQIISRYWKIRNANLAGGWVKILTAEVITTSTEIGGFHINDYGRRVMVTFTFFAN